MALYADVIIDITAGSLDKPFSYRIPEGMERDIRPGVRVCVPFGRGNARRTGYVIAVTDAPCAGLAPERIKELFGPDDGAVTVESDLIELAAQIRDRYGGTFAQALRTVMPVRDVTNAPKKRMLYPDGDPDAYLAYLELCKKRNYTKQELLLTALSEQPQSMAFLHKTYGITSSVVNALQKKGFVRVEEMRTWRNPVVDTKACGQQVALNAVQTKVVSDILESFAAGDRRPVLLHGVTGSGKTEVYMELIADTLRRGRQAIVLIPEISLTYQTLRRFYGRFGEQVSVLHSKMSAGERYDQFERAKNGEVSVMIGPRSALFTPFPDPGCIVIDEEHEGSYKSENTPRYHAREIALLRAAKHDALVVLGSATPSVDSYCNAERGAYRLLTMKERVEKRPLPAVYIADMREELKSGNRTILSEALRERMQDRLRKGEQSMLFINRRGVAGFVSCRSCGYVFRCDHCDVSMSLHADQILHCHYCGAQRRLPGQCPECGSPYIGTMRAGTQRIERDLQKEFPQARILRMDADTTRQKDGYAKILSAFSKHEADILLGTQMIVKGHDFPAVTLVGILAADLSLHISDYRASERTFQLLTQAAGRAGRGERPGEVVIQTYQPEHYSIQTAARQDYESFYRQEISFRKLMHYPPSWNMLLVRIEAQTDAAAQEAADVLRERILSLLRTEDLSKWQVIGPADAVVAKVKDLYRKVIYIKHTEDGGLIRLKNRLETVIEKEPACRNAAVQFDLNPMNG